MINIIKPKISISLLKFLYFSKFTYKLIIFRVYLSESINFNNF